MTLLKEENRRKELEREREERVARERKEVLEVRFGPRILDRMLF